MNMTSRTNSMSPDLNDPIDNTPRDSPAEADHQPAGGARPSHHTGIYITAVERRYISVLRRDYYVFWTLEHT